MSFPYILDIGFGSEQSTADNIGRVSFGSSHGGSKIPTTDEEFQTLVQEGLARQIPINEESTQSGTIYYWGSFLPSSGDNPAVEVPKSDVVGFFIVAPGLDNAPNSYIKVNPTYVDGRWVFESRHELVFVLLTKPYFN